MPVTSFCEYIDSQQGAALVRSQRRAAAVRVRGIWRPWTGVRGTKAAPEEGEHFLFSFPTTEANEVVRPVHAKAMPVLLTTPKKWDAWLTADVPTALALQRPLPAEQMAIVSTGQRQDTAPQP